MCVAVNVGIPEFRAVSLLFFRESVLGCEDLFLPLATATLTSRGDRQPLTGPTRPRQAERERPSRCGMRLGGRAIALLGLSLAHLFSALRSLAAVNRDDSVPLIMELLSARACPSGMVYLLQLAATGSLTASGVALALAATPGATQMQTARLAKGLLVHGAASLRAGRFGSGSTQPRLQAAQHPRALHLATIAAGVRESGLLATIGRPPFSRTRHRGSDAPAREPTAFLLDIDGTLVHTDDLYFRAFQELLAPYGYHVE